MAEARVCASTPCTNAFVAKRSNHKFCSSRCASRYHMRIGYARHPEKFKSAQRAYRAANPEKKRAASRAYRAANLDKVRSKERRRRYHLSDEAFDAMLASQMHACATCKRPFGDKTPVVDHDHSCCPGADSCGKCVRGLLCQLCNRAIGFMGDNPDTLRAAADYVSRTNFGRTPAPLTPPPGRRTFTLQLQTLRPNTRMSEHLLVAAPDR